MFNLFGRKTRRSNPNTSKLANRQLFLESLEDRRLLAADLSIVAFHVDGGSAIPAATFGGTVLNEGQVVTVDLQVDHNTNSTFGEALTEPVVASLAISRLSGQPALVAADTVVDTPPAVADPDITWNAGTSELTIAIGFNDTPSLLGAFQFTVVDDTVIEDVEQFQLNFSVDAANTISAPTSFNYDIQDDDVATISVHIIGGASALTVSGAELALGTQQIGFQLNGEFDRVLTGDIVVTQGSAVPISGGLVPGEDYEVTVAGGFSAQLDGSGFSPSSIVIQEDTVVEVDQSFTVNLQNLLLAGAALTPAELAAITSIEVSTITIENDDSATITLRDKTTGMARRPLLNGTFQLRLNFLQALPLQHSRMLEQAHSLPQKQ